MVNKGNKILSKDSQRISYVKQADIADPEMIEELERCAREGTPRPESQAIRAHVPAIFKGFANNWKDWGWCKACQSFGGS